MSSTQETTWKNQAGYVWSLLGSAVGFGTVLSFSALCYKNGGGAFIIPYIIALFIFGIPLLLLEGVIGDKWKMPLVSSYGKAVGPYGKILGWLAVLACTTIGAFYIVLTGYSVAYSYFTGVGAIGEDSAFFFKHTFLQASSSISDFGSLSIPVFLATALVAIFSWFVLIRQVRNGIEKICSLFMPLLALIMLAFAVIVCFIPGGSDGLVHFFKPDFSKLGDLSLWREVFGQLVFSLSLGLGIVVGYSRHTGEKINIARAMTVVALGDFVVSIISGIALFGCIAHLSHEKMVPFESIVTSDSIFDIGFIIFPKILAIFGPVTSKVVGLLFFFCVFIAGVTGVFSIAESIAGNVEKEFGCSRKKAVSLTLACIFALSIFFCMGNALYILDALAPMVIGTNMLIGSISLIVVFKYLSREIGEHPAWFTGSGKRSLYSRSLRHFVPLFLAFILVGNCVQEQSAIGVDTFVRWGWLAVALIISFMLAHSSRQRTALLRVE